MIDPLDVIYDNMEIGKYDEAIELAKQELLKDKDNEFLFRKLIGKSLLDRYIKNRNPNNFSYLKEAKQELESSWQCEHQQNEETLLFLADCEYHLGQFDQSIKHYQELSQILQFVNSQSVFQSQCNIGIGQCLIKKGYYKEAIVQFELEINSTDGKDPNEQESTLISLIYCNFKLNNLKEVDKFIKQLLLSNPKQQFTQLFIYNIFKILNRSEEVEAISKKMPQGWQNKIKKNLNANSNANEQNQIIIDLQKKVEQLNQQSQELNSKVLIAKEQQKQDQQKQDQQIEASQTSTDILKENPKNQDVILNNSLCKSKMKNLQESRIKSDHMLELNPKDLLAIQNLKLIAMQPNNLEKEFHLKNILQQLSSLKKFQNRNQEAIILEAQAQCYVQLKLFDQAEIFYQKCIEANPNYILGWVNWAFLGILTRKHSQVQEFYQIAKQLYNSKQGTINLTEQQLQDIIANFTKIEQYLQNQIKKDNILITKKRWLEDRKNSNSNLFPKFQNLQYTPTHNKQELISERNTYQNKGLKISSRIKLPPLIFK